MDLSPPPLAILRTAYPGRLPKTSDSCQFLLVGSGFSGAHLWRVASDPPVCLRRWPAGTTTDRLASIHDGIRRLADAGVPCLSVPYETSSGSTFVVHPEGLFELSPWLPGRADFHANASDDRLQAAMEWLAQMHLTADRVTRAAGSVDVPQASLGITTRLVRCEELLRGGAVALRRSLPTGGDPFITQVAEPLIDAFQIEATRLHQSLRWAAGRSFPAHLCLRDIWHDHVLFTDDRVTGVVDYDALRIDSPMADVSRLLGSLTAEEPIRWQQGWGFYAAQRKCSAEEEHLARIFHEANSLLAGLQWIDWLFLTRRSFADESAARARAAHWLRVLRSK